MSEAIPENYLNLVIKCPFPAGQTAGAMALGEFLQSDRGHEFLPDVLKNIEAADKILATGAFTPDEAIQTAFGGALVIDETGAIMRQPKEPEAPDLLHAQTAGAEKK
ncbi:MAG TPA: hypothetical protein VLF79_02635 [Candidatus Saccharimonadales bacterium]|nr:hypothetical protein [Candidatus Saccharimonadales bacterium]